ncbi:MAG: YfiR family protein [Cytophagaceae bacterium]|jgi:hypothetical protein|nr:YfiR family protein [Cytophagaceae bacterium]
MRHYIKISLLFAGILILSAQTPSTREYQLKAVFILNFTQFVEWPPNSFSSPQAPLVIGVLGKDPFGNYLEEVLSNEKINGHALVAHRYKSMEDIEKDCHVLYINLSESGKNEKIITNLKGVSILTVSDNPDFLKQGGMIRFYTKDNKIQLQINPEAAKSANLTISSKLLRLAEVITPKLKSK